MFHLITGFPNPSKCWMNMSAPNQTLINIGRREGAPPGKGPEIRSQMLLKLRDQPLEHNDLLMGFPREREMKILSQLGGIENCFNSGIRV
jgi:hypothetical protein